MQKYEVYYNESVRSLQIADHMTYVTYPLFNEKKLFLKIFDEIYKSIIYSVNAILCNNTSSNKISKLYPNNNENLLEFLEIHASSLLNKKQINKIKEIIEVYKKHKQSSMEFVKGSNVVIMSDNLNIYTLDIQKIKEYLLVSKELLKLVHKKVKDSLIKSIY
jgi:predicted nucleic acid-binding protein